MHDLIVIPARGGSKGIPLKNIYPIKGIPLIEYTLKVIFKAKLNETADIVVSTDSTEIKKTVEKYDIKIINRPSSISQDTSSTEAALLHAINYMKEHYGIQYDNIITMQPTSPLRKSATVLNFIQEFYKNRDKYDAQLSVTETRADYWKKNGDDTFERLNKNAPRRRQEREPLYIENSALYITKVEALLATNSILGTHPTCFVIDEIEGVDINEMHDIRLVETYIDSIREFALK
jgi:N-acylneuraminate cytidylyltransferase